MTVSSAERVVFLDYLRAFACLLVVFGHICFLGLNGYEAFAIFVPGVDANIFGADSAERNVFTLPSIWVAQNLGINVGPFGVGIFFVISGYLMARTIERETTKTFAMRRFFRIFPTLAAAALFTLIATYLYCYYAGQTSPHTLTSAAVSVLMLNAFTGHIDAIPVLWTLRVELVFYIIIAIAARFGPIGYGAILIICALCALYTLLIMSPLAPVLIPQPALYDLSVLTLDASQIIFIMLGVVIWVASKRKSLLSGGITGVSVFGIFAAVQYLIIWLRGAHLGGVDIANAGWAACLFILAMWSGMKWRWITPLRLVADISYPLYVVHVPLAWISLFVLGQSGLSMLVSTILTWVIVILAAIALHLVIEKRSQSWGRAFGRTASVSARTIT